MEKMLSIVGEKTDRRVRRTRQAIRQSFLTLMQEKHGFDQLRVQDIAERAGVNRATFYAHFEDKYALLEDFVAQAFEAKLAGYLPPDFEGVVGIRLLVRVTCELLDETLGTCSPATQAQHGALIMRQLQRQIKEVVRSDLKRQSDADRMDELMVSVISWAVFGTAFDWMQSPRRKPAEKLADEVIALVEQRLRPDTPLCTSDPTPASV
jgi:AcrR family transcriptional regulator